MRGATLTTTALSAAILAVVSTIPAQAETPPIRSFRPVSSSRVAVPFTPRPATAPSMTPRPVYTGARPHCPEPPRPKPPIAINIPKVPKPDHNKRTMALIQQNIAIMAALRAADTRRPCDPSWSAKKLARNGCPPAQVAPEPMPEPASPLPPLGPETVAAAAPPAVVAEN